MTGNSSLSNAVLRMPLTSNPDYNMSFDSLDANFGAGSADYPWDSTVANFTAINTGASSTQTVSPKDIFSDGLGSAPPSTAFTNLTSPDINESPYMADSYECSPLFQDNHDLGADTTDWFSLFPDTTDKPSANPMERQTSNVSLGEQTSSSSNSPLILDTSNYNRRKSSNPMSPAGHNRHSSVSGVKPRRRKGPLPPIAVDPEDKTALKRARNTLAARDSRQRKLDHVSSLEGRIRELEEREAAFKETLAGLGYNGPLLQ
jgi:general control protein GCN4